MNPHAHLLVGWLVGPFVSRMVGLSVCHNFLTSVFLSKHLFDSRLLIMYSYSRWVLNVGIVVSY